MMFLFVFTATDNTSDSDFEIVIASRSTAEFNRADTVVHQLFIYFNTYLFMNAFIDLSMTILTTFHHYIYIYIYTVWGKGTVIEAITNC